MATAIISVGDCKISVPSPVTPVAISNVLDRIADQAQDKDVLMQHLLWCWTHLF